VASSAPYNDGGGAESGHVRVFQLNTWTQVGADINGERASDLSGWSVSLSADGSRLAIGAPTNDEAGTDAGQVRVYSWNGTAWAQLGADLNGERAGDQSGYAVSLSANGSRVAIGAVSSDNGGNESGHVRVYQWDNAGSRWVQLGGDINGKAEWDASGHSVSMSTDGSRVAIGAPSNNDGGDNAGHVRVYEWNGTAWVQMGADLNGDTPWDESGSSVSLSGNGLRVAIGAPAAGGSSSNPGRVRVYEWSNGAWGRLGANINGEAGGDLSGSSVSLSADGLRVAIGAPFNDGIATSAGHVRVYEWSNGAWGRLGADIDGQAAFDSSGNSVSLSADGLRVAIGARFNDGNETNSGHVRVYEWNGTAWSLVTPEIKGEAGSDLSGNSVSLSADGSSVAIGAPFNVGEGSNSGHVRVFGTVQLVAPSPAPANPQQTPVVAPVTANPTTVAAAVVSAPSSVSYRTGNAQVTLRWSAVSGAAAYVVTTTNGTQVCATTSTNCVVNKLRNGRAYNYNVFAVNADGVRSATSTAVSARPGFQVKITTVKTKRSVSLSSIVTTPSKGRKTWTVTSGACRINGARLVTPTKKGSCKVRLSTARSGPYAAMSTTINISVVR
jgi:hypothetical protein